MGAALLSDPDKIEKVSGGRVCKMCRDIEFFKVSFHLSPDLLKSA